MEWIWESAFKAVRWEVLRAWRKSIQPKVNDRGLGSTGLATSRNGHETTGMGESSTASTVSYITFTDRVRELTVHGRPNKSNLMKVASDTQKKNTEINIGSLAGLGGSVNHIPSKTNTPRGRQKELVTTCLRAKSEPLPWDSATSQPMD